MRQTWQVLAFILLSSVSFSVSSQQESVQLTVTEVSDLIRVGGSLDFSQLLPGYEYSTNLTVRWNVPQSALKNINADRVPLYVRITPSGAGSWVYFDGGAKSLDFVFTCIVRDNACARDSFLSRSFAVYVRAPRDAAYPHSDGISANASLLPFDYPGAESAGAPQQVKSKGGLGVPSPGGTGGQGAEIPGSGPKTGFAVLANAQLGSIFIALFAAGAIFLIVYFREYLFEKLIAPRERSSG